MRQARVKNTLSPLSVEKHGKKGGRTRGTQATPLFLLVVAAIACGVYLNSLANQFVSDDRFLVIEHPHIREISDFPLIFTSGHMAGKGSYRPLTTFSFAVNYQVGGLNAFGYHLTNVALHGANTALLYLITRVLFNSHPAALLAAVFFALHPIHTEAVAWVSGRAEVLAAFFFLLAWLLYLRASAGEAIGAWYWASSLLLFFLALLSKEHTLMLPAVLFLSDVYRKVEGSEKGWSRLLNTVFRLYPAYLAVIGVYLLMRHTLYGLGLLVGSSGVPLIDNPLALLPPDSRLLTAVKVLGYYIALAFWPAELSVDHSYNQIPMVDSIFEPGLLPAVAALLVALGLAFLSFRTSGQVWFCVFFFFVMLAPASNILIPIGTIMAERVLYLPSFAVCLWAGFIGQRIMDWRRQDAVAGFIRGTALVGLIAMMALAGYRTLARNRDWKDEYSLWQSAARVSPSSAKVHLGLGTTLLQRGMLDDAVREIREALRIYPAYVPAQLQLGLTLLKKGAIDEAIVAYEEAVRRFPNEADLYVNLGAALMKKGRIQEAVAAYEQGIAVSPKSATAHHNLGQALVQQENFPQAADAFRKALELNPYDAETLNGLGYAYVKQGQSASAQAALQRALELRPDLPEAYYNLGTVHEQNGSYPEAIKAYESALRHWHTLPSLHIKVGRLYLEQRQDRSSALCYFLRALELDPDSKRTASLRSLILKLSGAADAAGLRTAREVCSSKTRLRN
ncbi:MAG: tetratricopeptide repeat protein [Deltaproteobacteria bacterium]|nr:tetratricopeptide repeat protein [Deltaproteobacteria bacterium]